MQVALLASTASTSGAPTTPPSFMAQGDLHEQSSHGATQLSGGPSSVTFESPTTPLLIGMTVHPFPTPTLLSSQVLAALSQPPPSLAFPTFTGKNPQLWKSLCEEYFQMFVARVLLGFNGHSISLARWACVVAVGAEEIIRDDLGIIYSFTLHAVWPR